MLITVNGGEVQIDDRATVAVLLEQRGLAQRPCAVEVNREMIPKRAHAARQLYAGDQVEIVTLVGGG